MYAAVCAADGIGLAGVGANAMDMKKKSVEELVGERTEKTLSVEALLESRNSAPVQNGKPVAQMPMIRRASSRSPVLSVRSSSMGEITELAKLNV